MLCTLLALLYTSAPTHLARSAWRRPPASLYASPRPTPCEGAIFDVAAAHSDLLRLNRNSEYNEIVSYHDELVSRHNRCVSDVLDYADPQGRISVNIILDALLQSRRRAAADSIVDSLTNRMANVSRLSLDTAHIVLKDATLRRSGPAATDGLFAAFFGPGNGSYLRPSARTLNILVEALRNAEEPERAWWYYNLLTSRFGVQPDMYTYSALVKLAESADLILSIVRRAVRQKGYATPPLVRCAVESAGKLGDPALACLLASHYLLGNDSVHRCADSGDSLMVALLHCPEARLDIKSLYAAVNLTAPAEDSFDIRVHGQRCSDAAMLLLEYGTVAGGTARGIALSNKGYCLLFTYLQRRLRDLAGVTQLPSPTRALAREGDDLKAFVAFGWDRYLSTASGSKNRLNGRVCDAYIRCFVDDAERAKNAWKRSILPLATQLLGGGQHFEELAEKSLQALMFVFGFAGRADLGLEVAVTVRKRGWTAGPRQQLAASYISGKSYVSGRTQGLPNSVAAGAGVARGLGSLVAGALESSMESELGFPVARSGVEASPRWPKIRLQFSASQPKEE